MKTSFRLAFVASVAFAAFAAPTMAHAQATATVCKDGTTSAVSGRGACSGHGGVDAAATKAEKKTVKREEKAATAAAKATPNAKVTVTCGDGTTSTATGRGACSGHGGVKAAAATTKPAAAPVAAPAAASKAAIPAAAPKAAAHAKGASKTAGSGAAEDNNPAGAVAKCKDGMYSHAASRQGACSRHGGVAQWMTK